MENEHDNNNISPRKRPFTRCHASPKKRLKLDVPLSAVKAAEAAATAAEPPAAAANAPPLPPPSTEAKPSNGIHSQQPSTSTTRKKFIYGNYNRYYGYRLTEKHTEDVRLKAFEDFKELFDGKDILDIGCNDGSVTIAIANKFSVNRITGIDIDRNLIDAAQRRLTCELQNMGANINDKIEAQSIQMPIKFKHCNYVLKSDDLLEFEEQQYDTILLLSVTKWMHLNFGDSGLQRAFKRIFRQLKDDGVLLLEAQNWKSYKRRKSLTLQINANFKDIQLRPDQFHDYLLSEEIGFESTFPITFQEQHRIDGFKRPIVAYRKCKSQ